MLIRYYGLKPKSKVLSTLWAFQFVRLDPPPAAYIHIDIAMRSAGYDFLSSTRLLRILVGKTRGVPQRISTWPAKKGPLVSGLEIR